MKEYECVQVGHLKDAGRTIDDWLQKGWRVHSYQATGYGTDVEHYVLFEKARASNKDS